MGPVINIAAYRFARLFELRPLRDELVMRCGEWGLKGTILLSPEGINLFVAGAFRGVDQLLARLRLLPGLEDLTPKRSESATQPFSRMLVRIKKEIIAFGVEGIDPATRTSPKLAPETLKQWLDEGRAVTLLDTRNDYEVKLGTFRGALPIGVERFREFPAAVERLPEEMKEQPLVMFCTGGIRCEKAGPFMERAGFQKVYQLDGGILGYFEECGGAHYDGECFVFDQRVGVDPALHETESSQCFACQTPLTAEEMRHPLYVPNVSCSYCFQPPAEQMSAVIARRQAAIARVTSPLPGSQPYDNERPLNVPAAFHRATLLETLCGVFVHVPREEWLALLAAGRILDPQRQPAMADRIVAAGERYMRRLPETVEPEVAADIRVLFEDESVIVVEKPAPLPIHPSGRFNRNTLQSILATVYAPQRPRAAHRLDANTTGLVIFARTRNFASLLQPQFARGEVEKTYAVRVQGAPAADEFFCDAAISAEPGALGSRAVDDDDGLPSRTEFQVIARLPDGTTLLEARPLTGRTNQIRVHLWQLGFPICGDPIYLAERQLGSRQTLSPGDPPLCLHAARVTFTHPLTQERVTFTLAAPDWFPAAELLPSAV